MMPLRLEEKLVCVLILAVAIFWLLSGLVNCLMATPQPVQAAQIVMKP